MTNADTSSEARLMAAAGLRRQAAEATRHEHGDTAFTRFRSTVPGVDPTAMRHGARTPRDLRAVTELRGGKELVHTSGYFTRYDMRYPMWDDFGVYHEWVARGSGAATLAGKPEVCFLTNHTGMAMARTTAGTLDLREDETGGWHDGWLNPARNDVHDLVIGIDDRDVPQMSYAFMIPDGGGLWSADFSEFQIVRWDIDGGDVSACNFGANPYTDISARSAEVLDELDHLPEGARREALVRLSTRPATARERVEVRMVPREVDAKASAVRRRSQGAILRTHARFAAVPGLTVADMATARLSWYEIRAGQPGPVGDPGAEPVESTDIFVFDEIGGSFGVSAEDFARDLNEITTPRIHLRVNSPGGSVTEGAAIRSALMHHPAWIKGTVDGIAASAASMLILGCDEVETMPGAQWLLHDASIKADANQAELLTLAEWTGRQSDNIADIYAERMGITREEARQMMLDETWAFASESVDMGLADRVGGPNPAKIAPDMADRMTRAHDLTRFGYRYTSRSEAPAPGGKRMGPASHRRTGTAPEITRSIPEQPKGRSIAVIEARLELDERS